MATHSSTLAWKIPWKEEPCRLQSLGSRRVGHDWATSLSLFTFMHWRIPGTGEPGGLLSLGSHRVGHDWSDLAAAAAAGTQQGCLSFPSWRGEWHVTCFQQASEKWHASFLSRRISFQLKTPEHTLACMEISDHDHWHVSKWSLCQPGLLS